MKFLKYLTPLLLVVYVLFSFMFIDHVEAKTIRGSVKSNATGTVAVGDSITIKFKANFDIAESMQFWLYGDVVDSQEVKWTYRYIVSGDTLGPNYYMPTYVDTAQAAGSLPKLTIWDATATTTTLNLADYDGWLHGFFYPSTRQAYETFYDDSTTTLTPELGHVVDIPDNSEIWVKFINNNAVGSITYIFYPFYERR